MSKLQAAGLNETEAKAYQALLTKKQWQPSELAKSVNESRTNMYKILDKLVEKKLAVKFDLHKKLHYRATNPSHLLELAHQERKNQEQAQKELELSTQELTAEYIKTHEQPAIRYFQGKKEISEIFSEIALSKETVRFVHTPAGADFYGFDFMYKLREKAAKNNIKRHAITPDSENARGYKSTDKTIQLERTWVAEQDYKSSVEWGAFEDKLYIISYGKEALGMIIESTQIAESFKELFKLIDRGQKNLSDYSTLPIKAR